MQAVGSFFLDYGTPFAVMIGVITSIFSLIVAQYFKESTRARAFFVFGLIVLGAISVFVAFYSKHADLTAHGGETARLATIRDGLGKLIHKGDDLMDELVTNQQPMPSDVEKDWGSATEEFLQRNLGEQYVTRLHNITGITPPKMSGMDWPHYRDWGMVYVRVSRLDEFLRELSGASQAPPPAQTAP
jgi:hypothetical protein